jgi:hypothetical protein
MTRAKRMREIKERAAWERSQHGDPRKFKRFMRESYHPIQEAWDLGSEAAWDDPRKPRRNPYPAGKRHDEYERGKATQDLMGEYHGRGH